MNTSTYEYVMLHFIFICVAEPEPVEPTLFGDLEPEPKINLKKYVLQSVWRMLGRRKANFYPYYCSIALML